MNLSEFKAWFEGFTENLDGPPGEKAWTKIKDKVKAITDAPTTYPVFVDRYIYSQPWRWNTYPQWQYVSNTMAVGQSQVVKDQMDAYGSAVMCSNSIGDSGSKTWDAGEAFRTLGRLEAQGEA